MTRLPRKLCSVILATAALWPARAAAEVLDRTAAVSVTASVPRLTPTAFAASLDQRNAVSGAAADLDGDGDLDLLIVHRITAEPPFLLVNDGHARFTDEAPARLPALPAGETWSVTVADLDGDGDLDVYLGRSPLDMVLFNDGTGHFTDGTNAWLPAGFGGSSDAAAADITGDGRVDIAVVQSGAVHVLENVRQVALQDISAEVAAPASGVVAIALADVDGDGDVDLAGAGAANIQVWLNDRPRLRASTAVPNPSEQRITGLTAADVTGDGLPDLLVARHDLPLLLTNQGGASFVMMYLPGRTLAYGIQAADVDGDGRKDLFMPSAGADVLLFNGGSNAWVTRTGWFPLEAEAGRWAALADFNADHLIDLFVANDGQDQLYLQRAAP